MKILQIRDSLMNLSRSSAVEQYLKKAPEGGLSSNIICEDQLSLKARYVLAQWTHFACINGDNGNDNDGFESGYEEDPVIVSLFSVCRF